MSTTTCIFMENWRKLSQNYHQILFLIKSPRTLLTLYHTCSGFHIEQHTDPNQIACSVASDLDLRCLLRPVCPNTYSYYGKQFMPIYA